MSRKKITDLLSKAQHLIAMSDTMSSLEKDLVKQYLREAYELIEHVTGNTNVVHSSFQQPEELIAHIQPEVKPAEKVSEPLLEAVKVHPVITTEPEKPREQPVFETKLEVETSEIIPKNIPINERIQTNTSTLNESVKTSGADLHKRLGIKPMKELIDFNKRFLFINDLFKGSTNEYSQVIQGIDAAASYEDAIDTIKGYNWDSSTQSVKLFHKLVKQRFGIE